MNASSERPCDEMLKQSAMVVENVSGSLMVVPLMLIIGNRRLVMIQLSFYPPFPMGVEDEIDT